MKMSAWSIRTYLLLLVVTVVAALLAFSFVTAYRSYVELRETLSTGMLNTVRVLSTAMDREFTGSVQALKVLAASDALDRGNLAAFYNEMKTALAAFGPAWQNLTLADRSGQQLINLRLPMGSPLPRLDPKLIEHNLRTGEPTLSELFRGPVTGAPSLVVSLPIFKNNEIKYLLRAGFSTSRLMDVLTYQKLSPDWLATVLDRNQIIVARTRGLEKLLGKPASPTFAARARHYRESAWTGSTVEGVEVTSALYRSALTGLTVGIAIPAAEANAPLRDSLAFIAAGGSLLLLLGTAATITLGRRMAGSLAQLGDASEILGRGGMLRIPTLPISEANQLARALEDAAVKREELGRTVAESEARYRQVVETALEGIWAVDENYHITFVNQRALDMLGYSREEVLGQTPFRFFDEASHARAMPSAERRKTGTAEQVELTMLRKDGSSFTVLMNSSPIITGNNTFSGAVGMFSDITERRRAEAKERELNQRLVTTLENMHDAFVALDRDWRYTYVNARAAEMFGRSAASLLGKRYYDEYPEAAGTPFEQGYCKAMTERVALSVESHYAPWNRWFENRIFPTEEGIAVFFHEITDRKQAEERIAQQLEELRRWQAAMLGREERVQALKREVNELLEGIGQPRRYLSQES